MQDFMILLNALLFVCFMALTFAYAGNQIAPSKWAGIFMAISIAIDSLSDVMRGLGFN